MPRKAPAPPNPAIKRCIDLFHDTCMARHGIKPLINGGKDGAHMKQMLATWGEPTVRALIREFFHTTDPRVLRSDYTIGALYGLAQHLLLRLNGRAAPDTRTAENLDAATRAMQPRTAARQIAREGEKQ